MRVAFALLVAVVTVPMLQAAELDAKRVSAEATWLVHLDIELSKTHTLSKRIDAHFREHHGAEKFRQRFEEKVGLDPSKDLKSITLYGDKLEMGNGVLLVEADVDQKTFLAHLQEKKDYASEKDGDTTFYTWTEWKGRKREHPVAFAFAKPTLMVFAGDVAGVKSGLAVLAGDAKSLAGSDSPLVAEAPQGTGLIVRASGLSEAKLPFRSPVIRESKLITMAAGQVGEEMFVKASIETASPETAQNVRAVLDGLKALIFLRKEKSPEGAALAEGMKITVDGATANIDWKANAEKVVAVAEKMHKKMHEKRMEKFKKYREKREKSEKDAPQKKDGDE